MADRFVRPSGGVTDGYWPKSDDEWWCSTGIFGSLAFHLYAETGDESCLRIGLGTIDWLNRQDLLGMKDYAMPIVLMYSLEAYSASLPYLEAGTPRSCAGACAWVNLLSIFALSSYPAHGTFSASKAAACSLSLALRAEMLRAGIRVLNVFPGPLDDEWNQLVMPPKLAPAALARAIVDGLRAGVEDLYPGDVAQEWFARWRDNPKALERELRGDRQGHEHVQSSPTWWRNSHRAASA